RVLFRSRCSPGVFAGDRVSIGGVLLQPGGGDLAPSHNKRIANLITPMAYSVVDAARVLGIGKTKFYELVNQGEIPTIKIGSRTLVPHDELAAFVERQRNAA